MSLPAPVHTGSVRILEVFGHRVDHLHRQPWAAADALARAWIAAGHAVVVRTDRTDHGLDGRVPYRVEAVDPEMPALADADGLRFRLTGIAEVVRPGWPEGVVPVLASPRLRLREVLPALVRARGPELRLLLLPLANALLPTRFVARMLCRRAGPPVYGSPMSRARLVRAGAPFGPLLPPPRTTLPEGAATHPSSASAGLPRPVVTWFGPPLAARGVDLVVRAYLAARRAGFRGSLQLLLRPDDARACAKKANRLRRRLRGHPVAVTAAFLAPDECARRLFASDVFLLPFRAPVSELPLVVFEAAATGRPVIVLDRPGIGDWGRLLGLRVARTPADLARELLALPAGPTPQILPPLPADPLEDLPPDRAARVLRTRVFALIGPDGSGKTTLARALERRLAAAGAEPVVVWSRWRHHLSRPLCLLLRLLGKSRTVERDGVRFRLRDAARPRLLAWTFLLLSALDLALDVLVRVRLRRRPVIADRLIVDSLVDLAVETGLEHAALALARPLWRLVPRPCTAVVLWRPLREIAETRPDALIDPRRLRRLRLYRRFACRLGLPLLRVRSSPEAMATRILRGELP